MKKYNKIGAIGDSYSSTTWGLSWPDLVAEKMNCEFIRASSSGAGNAFYIEKCHDIVKDPTVDLVIVQLTEPSRVVLGFKTWEINPTYNWPKWAPPPADYSDPAHSNCYKDIGCYTMNVTDNQRWLKPLLNMPVEQFDNIWMQQIAGAKFWEYQALHHMLSIKALCDAHNKKLIFWTWFVEWHDIFLPGYEWLQEALILIPSTGRIEAEKRQLPITGGHYATTEYRTLVDEWLWPNLDPLL
jgi:hypothetical protein